MSAALTAQGDQGLDPDHAFVKARWGTGFNHTIDAADPANVGTDPIATSTLQGTGFSYTLGPVNGRPVPFGFGFSLRPGGGFNSVHMCLIPKGIHQGKVLVWDEVPVILRPNASLDPTQRWFFQAWSIIDPAPGASPRFRNFLLPLEPLPSGAPADTGLWVNGFPALQISDLFCAGHAWTHDGNLVVAGGQTLPVGAAGFSGAKWLFLFDPAVTSQSFPNGPGPLYPGEVGNWFRAPNIAVDRFYPTVTISPLITRNQLSNRLAIVSGGTLNGGDENSYESFVIGTSPAGPTMSPDPEARTFHSSIPRALTVIPGPNPGAITSPTETNQTTYQIPSLPEGFGEYPRMFQLADGTLFHAGSEPLSAKFDLRLLLQPSTGPARQWDRTVGRVGGSGLDRHDGCCVHVQNVNGLADIIVRMGGSSSGAATDTAEFWYAGAFWTDLPDPLGGYDAVPGGPRTHANAVMLPDGSIVVIGGDDGLQEVRTTAVYRLGQGWARVIDGDSPGIRRYHTCAILLPDGRVFVGGGENSDPSDNDYDIFEPTYFWDNPTRPLISSIVSIDASGGNPTPLTPDPDGTLALSGQTNGAFRVTCANVTAPNAIANIALMAPGAMTHHSDMSARMICTNAVAVIGNPSQRDFLPPPGTPSGYYMLFALDAAGIPSVARWVRIP